MLTIQFEALFIYQSQRHHWLANFFLLSCRDHFSSINGRNDKQDTPLENRWLDKYSNSRHKHTLSIQSTLMRSPMYFLLAVIKVEFILVNLYFSKQQAIEVCSKACNKTTAEWKDTQQYQSNFQPLTSTNNNLPVNWPSFFSFVHAVESLKQSKLKRNCLIWIKVEEKCSNFGFVLLLALFC